MKFLEACDPCGPKWIVFKFHWALFYTHWSDSYPVSLCEPFYVQSRVPMSPYEQFWLQLSPCEHFLAQCDYDINPFEFHLYQRVTVNYFVSQSGSEIAPLNAIGQNWSSRQPLSHSWPQWAIIRASSTESNELLWTLLYSSDPLLTLNLTDYMWTIIESQSQDRLCPLFCVSFIPQSPIELFRSHLSRAISNLSCPSW